MFQYIDFDWRGGVKAWDVTGRGTRSHTTRRFVIAFEEDQMTAPIVIVYDDIDVFETIDAAEGYIELRGALDVAGSRQRLPRWVSFWVSFDSQQAQTTANRRKPRRTTAKL